MKVTIYFKNNKKEVIDNVWGVKYFSTNLFGTKKPEVKINYIIPGQLICGEIQDDEPDYKRYKMKEIDILEIL